ncbi:hypothetical protein ACSC9U_05155 [Pseudomonas solani]|uniref:hypothetical protein n=1 Tax=Pseudomonas solani TaxID=2731552 RepID=UPI003F4A8C06
MTITVLGTSIDLRTTTPVAYLQCTVLEYLRIVGEEFYKFEIQRKREKFSAYNRLKSDIKDGTLLPIITLAAPIDKTKILQQAILSGDHPNILQEINNALPLNILDGLQRTYILKELTDAGHVFPDEQKIHLEIRAEPDLDHLIYRIIVLNAGQKPMSMRHQIDILSLTLKKTLSEKIQRLELVPEVEGGRRTKARKFSLDRVAGAYHAFLLKSPEVDKQNVVAQRLSEQNVLEQDVEQFGIQFKEFEEFFELYCELDDAVEHAQIKEGNGEQTSALNWLGSENTINAFFAAAADFGSTNSRKKRTLIAIRNLIHSIELSESTAVLGLDRFQEIISGFPSRKTNIGFATRKLIFVCFKEFFRDEGQTAIGETWEREAE